eukprot:TRINITY_DN33262_c0_g1_i1.p1 TRINITY_DN33262_c0_g1~~TRINITY_DN33262_c0_g1_i1.p1  ORF type:complete len:308 (+),score=102.91 TRINITY_DN33262_c0_g1_i1:40-963(+)
MSKVIIRKGVKNAGYRGGKPPGENFMRMIAPTPPPGAPQEPEIPRPPKGLKGEVQQMLHYVPCGGIKEECVRVMLAYGDVEGLGLEKACAVLEERGEGPSRASFLLAVAIVADEDPLEEEFTILLLREAEAEGSIVAAVELGARLLPNHSALPFLDKACKKDHPKAQYLISCILEDGLSNIPTDQVLARKWLTRAADAQYPPATYLMGLRSEQGTVNAPAYAPDSSSSSSSSPAASAPDYTKAYKFYVSGALKGHVDSQLGLGKLYLMGALLPPPQAMETKEKASKWLSLAASNGSVEATHLLSRII